MRRFALLAMASERAFLASEGAISFFGNHGANGCERYVLLVSMCASETDTCMMDVVSDMHVVRTRVVLSDVRLSVLSAQLSGVCFCFKKRSNARKVTSLHGPRPSPGTAAKKKKSGQWRHLPAAIAAVPSTERSKKSNVQRRAATWGPLLRHRSRALPTTLEAEFVATAGMLGPQIRWSSPCWRAHL